MAKCLILALAFMPHCIAVEFLAPMVVGSASGVVKELAPDARIEVPRRLRGGHKRGKNAAAVKGEIYDDANKWVKPCDASTTNLRDFEVWRREEGFWFGEYTFLGADGDPFKSPSWNYPYAHYYGFIHLELDGPRLKQRNVFIYPPQTADVCETDDSVVGEGTCGANGNEKIFSADQEASDCNGNLAGPYTMGAFTLETTTTIMGDDTVVYAVKLPEQFGGKFNQNQLTTLPGNGVRVRTAQGFDFDEQPSFASFYREVKMDKADWLAKLAEVRAGVNVLASDECAWVTGAGTTDPSGVTCEEHFGFAV